MNVIVFASRKGGSGKSTLAAHIAAHVNASRRRTLLIDCDPQRSLTLWHRLRPASELALRDGTQGVSDIVRSARHEGFDWVFVDTPPNTSAVVTDAVHAATLVVIPARLTVFDIGRSGAEPLDRPKPSSRGGSFRARRRFRVPTDSDASVACRGTAE